MAPLGAQSYVMLLGADTVAVELPLLDLSGGQMFTATVQRVGADSVTPAAARPLRAAGNQRVTVRVFPDVNHLFLPDPSGYPQGYGALKPDVSGEVLGTLADRLAREL